MSRARGDGRVGRRSVPPLDCGSVSAGTEPRRERPHLPPRSVTPRAAQGSFTSRFRVSVFACRCGAAASWLRAIARRVCVQDPARVLSARNARLTANAERAMWTANVSATTPRSSPTIRSCRPLTNPTPRADSDHSVLHARVGRWEPQRRMDEWQEKRLTGRGAARAVRPAVSARIRRRRRARGDRAGRMGAFTAVWRAFTRLWSSSSRNE